MIDEHEKPASKTYGSSGPESVRPVGKTVKKIDYTKPSQQLINDENEAALERARKTK